MPAKKEEPERDRRKGGLWEPVDLSPEEIAKACMQGPPKEKWDYLTKEEKPAESERVL